MEQKEDRSRLCHKTAHELLDGYKSKEISPVDVIKDILKRIQEVNPIYNCMVFVQKEEILLKQAEESAKRWQEGKPQGILDGVPITIKDLFFVPGMPTTEGSKIHPFPPDYHFTSPSVQGIIRSSAIIIGKVSTSEYGWRCSGISPLSGITRNAYDHSRITGGSSAGSGVAVALGFAPLSIGSDAGGSIRVPACFNNVTALKPSVALVPHAPVSVFGPLAVVGPFARDAKDLNLLLDVISFEHIEDPRSIFQGRRQTSWQTISETKNPEDFLKNNKNSKCVKQMKVAVSYDLGGYVKYVDPEVKKCISDAVEIFRSKLGAEIHFIDSSPDFPTKKFDTYKIMKTIWSTAVHYLITYISESQKETMPYLRATLEPELITAADRGAKYSAIDLASANHKVSQFAREMNKFYEKYDIILTPAQILEPFEAEKEVPDNIKEIATGTESEEWEEVDYERFWCWTPFSYVFNMSRQPACVVPCGKFGRGKGLPIGLQIAGKIYDDASVLRAAVEFQSVTDWHERVANEKL